MIYLASIPRCGSTYLFRCMAGLPQGPNTPPGAQEAAGIVKTHLPPAADPRVDYSEGDSAVFLWGDIVHAVESTRRMRYNAGHAANCGADWPPPCDIRDGDVLGYERIWDAWRDPGFGVLWVRYEHLWRHTVRHVIERWTGIEPIAWLEWRERKTRVSGAVRSRIESAYRPLLEKMDGEPGTFVRGTRAAA